MNKLLASKTTLQIMRICLGVLLAIAGSTVGVMRPSGDHSIFYTLAPMLLLFGGIWLIAWDVRNQPVGSSRIRLSAILLILSLAGVVVAICDSMIAGK
jgi:peptidoglycan/LPS O-acetylase OafA/YrhL